jgi:hypothetical protein
MATAARHAYPGFATFELATDRKQVHLVNDGDMRR